MRVAILANGVERHDDFLLEQLARHDRSICADGGFRRALEIGWIPDAVVGDFDSLGAAEMAALAQHDIPVVRGEPEKDQSDLEMALELAQSWKAGLVTLLGALDGRVDHMLFNMVSCLCRCRQLGLPARVKASKMEAFLVWSEAVVEGREGALCSLLSLDEETRGVTLRGFQYGLENETLYRHSTRGLSNRIVAPRASIRVKQGLLLAQLSSMNG